MRTPGSSTSAVRVLAQGADEPVLCTVRGEIDISNVEELSDGLTEAFRQGPAVVADLSEVTFFASAGVRALFDACLLECPSGPERILGVVTGPGVDTILRICGLSTVAVCRPDREAAGRACLAALRASRTG